MLFSKIFLTLSLSILFVIVGCFESGENWKDKIKKLGEWETSKNFTGIQVNISQKVQIISKSCESGEINGLRFDTLITGAVDPTSIEYIGIISDSVSHVIRFSSNWELFNKIREIIPVAYLDGTMQCNTVLALEMSTGDKLIHSKINVDNLIGLNYRRKPISGNWSLYVY